MAKKQNATALFESLKEEIVNHRFRPLYILSGEEPFYTEKLCNLIIENALEPDERDFNYSLFYGADTDVSQIILTCERYPMMAQRTLVVVKEAQSLKKIEELEKYLDHLSESTVLVLLLNGKQLDARTRFYKKAGSVGVIFDSPKISEDQMPGWITSYFRTIGLQIDPDASLLLAEYAGNDLRKISLEAEKLTRSLPVDGKVVTTEVVERNVGISKEFSINAFTKAIATMNRVEAFRIAYYFGESPKMYPLPKTLGFLFYFFSKVEMIRAEMAFSRCDVESAARKRGFSSFFYADIRRCASVYDLRRVMRVIAYIRECDLKSKSNLGGMADEGELLTDLLGKIFNA